MRVWVSGSGCVPVIIIVCRHALWGGCSGGVHVGVVLVVQRSRGLMSPLLIHVLELAELECLVVVVPGSLGFVYPVIHPCVVVFELSMLVFHFLLLAYLISLVLELLLLVYPVSFVFNLLGLVSCFLILISELSKLVLVSVDFSLSGLEFSLIDPAPVFLVDCGFEVVYLPVYLDVLVFDRGCVVVVEFGWVWVTMIGFGVVRSKPRTARSSCSISGVSYS